jgi:hypothetical protein
MKRVKLFLAAATLVTVVGGAFAFKTAERLHANLFICTNGVCTTPTVAYSTVAGQLVNDPPPTYTGIAGKACSTTNVNCKLNTTLPVYINN